MADILEILFSFICVINNSFIFLLNLFLIPTTELVSHVFDSALKSQILLTFVYSQMQKSWSKKCEIYAAQAVEYISFASQIYTTLGKIDFLLCLYF